MSIIVSITSLVCMGSSVLYDEKVLECIELYRDDDCTIVKLPEPIPAYFYVGDMIRPYNILYVRLITATGSIAAYMPHDYDEMSTGILETVLSVEPSIVQAYRPISGHTFTIQ